MDEQKLRAYYDAHPEQFTDVIQTAHILVEDEALANALYEKVAAGQDFSALAEAHSICPSSAKGGDLGFFPRGLFVAEYEAASRRIERVGDFTTPVKSRFGYHIIKLLDKKAVLEFEACKDTIAMILENPKT